MMAEPSRIEELIQKHLDELLSQEEFIEMDRLLRDDPAAAEAFSRLTRMDALLRRQFGPGRTPIELSRLPPVRESSAQTPRRRRWILAGTFAAAIGITVCIAFFVLRREPPMSGPRIVRGRVTVNGRESERVAEGATLESIGPDNAFIRLANGSEVELEPASRCTIRSRNLIDLTSGAGRFVVQPTDAFRVDTPLGSARVLGTDFTVRLRSLGENGVGKPAALVVRVAKGRVAVDFGGKTQIVEAGLERVFADEPLAKPADETSAVLVPPESSVPPDRVRPLLAQYYDFERVRPIGTPGIDSIEIAKQFVASHKPDLTYSLGLSDIDFPRGPANVVFANKTTVGEFLLGDQELSRRQLAAAQGKTEPLPPQLARKMSSRSIFVFHGFFEVKKAGVYEFRTPCDDGCELKIGGVIVHVISPGGGWYGPLHETSRCRVKFNEPGIYPLQLLLFDKAREIGVELYSDVDPTGERRDLGGGHELNLLRFLNEVDR